MMKSIRKIVLSVLFVLCFFIFCSSPTLIYKNPKYNENKIYKIAVLPLEDAEGFPGSGDVVARILETSLLYTGKFETIERMQINKILEEQKLSLTGILEKPIELGKLLRADVIVTGSVTTWLKGVIGKGNFTTVGASVKAVDVKTGEVLWSMDKSNSANFFSDGMPVDSPCDMVAKKMCREMVADLFK